MAEKLNLGARGVSTGGFLALFLIPWVLTYVVGWLSPFLGLASFGASFASSQGQDTGGLAWSWLLLKAFMILLYIVMAAASYLRGVVNGRKWGAGFPLAAGVFDVFLPFVPFVPTVLAIVALVVGVAGGERRSAATQ